MPKNIHSVIIQVVVVLDDDPEPVGAYLKYLPSEEVQSISASTPSEFSAQAIATLVMSTLEA